MKAMKLLIVLLLCVAVVVAQDDPTPPKLETAFISNFTLGVPDLNSSGIGYPYHGWIAIDYQKGGGFFELKGTGIVPLYLETNFVAVPTDKNVDIYWYSEEFCWGNFTVPFNLSLFPLEVPRNASYVGQQTVNNQVCSVWSFLGDLEFVDVDVTMWVDVKLSTIVQIEMTHIELLNVVQWSFENTIIGSVDPAIYQKPDLDCVEPPIDSFFTSITDTLFRTVYGWNL